MIFLIFNFHFLTQLLMEIWVVSSFGENTYISLLGVYLGVEFLGDGVCILLALVGTAKVSKMAVPIYILTCSEWKFSCFTSSPTSVLSVFLLS